VLCTLRNFRIEPFCLLSVRRRDDAAVIVGQVGVTYVERKLWAKAESSDWLEVWWQQQQPRRQQQQQQERYKKRVATA
jgi:hypothetical protein